mmetsp:Transcript_2029/g.5997  ORF Transcript_2029/g.5997 Transcript_2029/m.5997 type:complete len:82 (+) Transcript_2029:697-942(+)
MNDWHQGSLDPELAADIHHLAIPKNFELQMVSDVFGANQVSELYTFVIPKLDGAIISNRNIVDLQNHIPLLQDLSSWGKRV